MAAFVRQAWAHVLNPGRALEWGWYLDAICLHLEAVARRDPRVRRLIITQPPNTLKSTITSVCWPAWVWVSAPETRFLFAANDGPLATRDAIGMRDLVESDWYQQSFGPAWKLRADQDQKTWFTNTAGGHRISYSVNGKVTGKKGDVLVIDDANDAKKVFSEAERQAVFDWHDLAFSGRVADERASPEVVVGQRVHPGDLIGHLLKKPGWVELRLAEEYDPARHCSTPLWGDPRDRPGEFLRPTRFGPAEKADAIARLSELGYAAQHLEDPRESAGTWFEPGKLAGIIPQAPVGTVAVRYWDTAASAGETACETAGVLVGRTPDGRFVVIDVEHGRWQPLDRNPTIRATAHADRRRPGVRVVTTGLEQEPGGSGLADAQAIARELAGFSVFLDKVTGDKDVRIRPFAGQWQARNVFLVEGPWNAAYLAQMKTIPGARRLRDMADATAGAFNKLTEAPAGTGLPGLPNPGQETMAPVSEDAYR